MNIDRYLKMTCAIDIVSDKLNPRNGMYDVVQQLTDIPCRIEPVTEQYVDSKGTTRISKMRIFLKQEVKPGDIINDQPVYKVDKCYDVGCQFSHYEATL